MRNYQNWLDLQHYELHLKRLVNIKNRSPLLSPDANYLNNEKDKCKIRSRTICHEQKKNRKTEHQPRRMVNAAKLGVQSTVNRDLRQIDYESQQQLQVRQHQTYKKQIILQNSQPQSSILKQYKNNQLASMSGNKQQRGGNKKIPLNRNSENIYRITFNKKQNKQETNLAFNNTKQASQENQDSFEENRLEKRSGKMGKILTLQKGEHLNNKQSIRKKAVSKNDNQIKFHRKVVSNMSKESSGWNLKQMVKQDRLQKYLRFSEQNMLAKVHCYMLEINVNQMSNIPNSQLITYWFQAQTFRQLIKSHHFTIDQLRTKPIYFSFLHKPKGVINIAVRYYRKLEQFCFGQHLVVLDKSSQLQKTVQIECQNSFSKMSLSIKGKIISKTQATLKKNRKSSTRSIFEQKLTKV